MIAELFEDTDPSRQAITIAGKGPSLTYEGLRRQVDLFITFLNSLGFTRGDRIAIALPNSLEMIVSFLAVAEVGTAAPLNPAYKQEEFRFYLKDTGAKALIIPAGGSEAARSAADENLLIIGIGIDAHGEIQISCVNQPGHSRSREYPNPNDIALVLHTSGTTSRPKRVPLSHANLLASAHNIAKWYNLSREDISLCVMPLFHVHGLVASTLAMLYAGGNIVVAPRFIPLSFWSTLKEHRVSWFTAVPTIHNVLLSRAKIGMRPPGSEHLRFIRSCSAPLPPGVMVELEDRFGVPVLEAYGMTESAHQMASSPCPPGRRKPGSVGYGTAVEIAILDENGTLLPTGARGEVSIKGPNVFSGYEENPEANAASFTNGWFRTGDEGYLDNDGYLTLTGRLKEMINRGGEKISPQEIDELLLMHPAVAEACCFAIPDRHLGEEVAAAVVLKGQATDAELIAHCKSVIADFKCPKTIHITEALPRTATGKVQRRQVAAAMNEPMVSEGGV